MAAGLLQGVMNMYKIITNVCNVLLFTVIIMFFSVFVAVLLIASQAPYEDYSKENVLLTSNFVLALVSAYAVNNIVTKKDEHV